MDISTEVLEAAFRKVGRGYGYESVSAEFTDFREFKVQWSRSCRYAHFRVSDYLSDAPQEVFEGLANTLFAKIAGKEEVPYSKTMREWVLSPAFSENKRPTYIERSDGITGCPEGEERDLMDSVDRLVEMGLIDPDEDFVVSWNEDEKRKAASSSLLMRLIAVSSKLDDAEIPDFVVDYAVYSQYLKIVKGARVFGFTTEVYTRDDERKFGKYKEAERMLDKMYMHL